ncbi:MAG: hypothetical protein QF473_00935 [Planctomycetota bacterium]|nr:hypothetical protein [Planctomycetota bacterium]
MNDIPSWRIEAGEWSFEGDRFVAQPLDSKGQPAGLAFCSAVCSAGNGGCHEFEIACDVTADDPISVSFAIDEFQVGIGNGRLFLARHNFHEVLLPFETESGRTLHMELHDAGQGVTFSIDGTKLLDFSLKRPICSFGLITYTRATFDRLSLKFSRSAEPPQRKPVEQFRLSCAVDFLDDMRKSKFTTTMLREYMKRLNEMGVTRVYWEDVHLLREDFLTDPEVFAFAQEDLTRNPPGVWETMQQGWDEFAEATQAAHEVGLEMFALIKPFDWHYYDVHNEKGNWNKIQQFLFNNPDKVMQRRPPPTDSAPIDAPIGTIRLVSRSDTPLRIRPADITIWVSEDNVAYRRYGGPIKINESVGSRRFTDWWTQQTEPEQRVRIVTFSGMLITSPYVAIRCAADTGSLLNRLYRLVEVEAVGGRSMPITFATEFSGGEGTGSSVDLSFQWDVNRGIPSARSSRRDFIEEFRAIDGYGGWLGFTRGALPVPRRKWVPLCPACPDVRDLFLSIVQHAIDCGTDGIDLRAPDGHTRCLEWAMYGFNAPMIEAYRERHGVDPSTEPYDRAAFCRLAGEFYDRFVKAASLLCRENGKQIQHHIFIVSDISPEERGPMNIYPNWRRWITEGWLDGVTLKEVSPGTSFFNEVMEAAATAEIETHYCKFLMRTMNTNWHDPNTQPAPNAAEIISKVIRSARDSGCDGHILYEGGAFLKGTTDGHVLFISEQVSSAIREATQS